VYLEDVDKGGVPGDGAHPGGQGGLQLINDLSLTVQQPQALVLAEEWMRGGGEWETALQN
jgi:hypothetical protein